MLWVTKSFAEPITLGHNLYPHRSQKLQYAIDCADRTYALEQWVLTDGADGSISCAPQKARWKPASSTPRAK